MIKIFIFSIIYVKQILNAIKGRLGLIRYYAKKGWSVSEKQCRNCGSLMPDKRSCDIGRCFTCRKNEYVRNELILLFGHPRVPILPMDKNGNIIWRE